MPQLGKIRFDYGSPLQRGVQTVVAPPEYLAMTSNPAPHTQSGYLSKRALDVVGASLLTLIFSPVIVVVAGLIWKQTGRPVIYRQERVGRNGRPFQVLKFRTMVNNADEVLACLLASDAEASQEWLATRKLKNDPRITHVGGFLRKTSLDELPQLFNVFKGDMSLVGPRPIDAEELSYYGQFACGQFAAAYLSAKPGITGEWQVSGRSDISYQERVQLDTDYISNPGVARDISVLMRTVAVVLFGRGAY